MGRLSSGTMISKQLRMAKNRSWWKQTFANMPDRVRALSVSCGNAATFSGEFANELAVVLPRISVASSLPSFTIAPSISVPLTVGKLRHTWLTRIKNLRK